MINVAVNGFKKVCSGFKIKKKKSKLLVLIICCMVRSESLTLSEQIIHTVLLFAPYSLEKDTYGHDAQGSAHFRLYNE